MPLTDLIELEEEGKRTSRVPTRVYLLNLTRFGRFDDRRSNKDGNVSVVIIVQILSFFFLSLSGEKI